MFLQFIILFSWMNEIWAYASFPYCSRRMITVVYARPSKTTMSTTSTGISTPTPSKSVGRKKKVVIEEPLDSGDLIDASDVTDTDLQFQENEDGNLSVHEKPVEPVESIDARTIRNAEMLERARINIQHDAVGQELAQVLAQTQVEVGQREYENLISFRVKKVKMLASQRGIEIGEIMDGLAAAEALVTKPKAGKKKSDEEVSIEVPLVSGSELEPSKVDPVYELIMESFTTLESKTGTKPSTNYITFAALARPLVKASNPEMTGPKIITELGRLWREAPRAVKEVFEARYNEEKKAYDAFVKSSTDTESD